MSRLELTSQVLITPRIEETIKALEALKSDERIVKIVKEDNFLVEDAALAIEKAYLASEETTVIILAARLFSPVVQNKLLKVIEEPPPHKEFILLTPSKATILATIRSRLPVHVLGDTVSHKDLGLDLSQLSLETVYPFVQEHKRTAAAEMKRIVEDISKAAMRSGKFNLDDKTLKLFSDAFMALDMGSPPSFVLNTLLLKLLAKKKR
ncbi:MAG: DNA polymerase III subunit delta' [Campylobacterales bacterium]|nr:DNA polymerase III subunit delta' [Campylobacterales bacterium]HEO98779.1 DNA polymerase III subunit delta' [Campylobacterota bacterium]